VTDLGCGWTITRLRKLFGAQTRLGDPGRRSVTCRGTALAAAVVLELPMARFLVKDTGGLWYVAIGDDRSIVCLTPGLADLERAIWET